MDTNFDLILKNPNYSQILHFSKKSKFRNFFQIPTNFPINNSSHRKFCGLTGSKQSSFDLMGSPVAKQAPKVRVKSVTEASMNAVTTKNLSIL